MIGVFSKDIWGIIFEKLETNFNPHALNNLSLTCKRLNVIDKQHRQNYIKDYEKMGPLIEKLQKGRQDYVNLVKYAPLTCPFYRYYYFPVTFKLLVTWIKRNLSNEERDFLLNLKEKEVMSDKERDSLFNLKEKEIVSQLLPLISGKFFINFSDFPKDIILIERQINAPKVSYVLSYIKNRGDIVNTIMDLQFPGENYYENFRLL